MANKTKRIANGDGTNGNYVFRATEEQKNRSRLGSLDEFWRLHRKSLEDPDAFWTEAAAPFYWKVPIPKDKSIGNYNIDVGKGRVFIEWLKGASTNICYNALDRNVQNGHGEQIAYYCDEAHFWLNGYVNKQNCRIWSEANPQVYVETPLHPEKLTVWCALWAGGILLQKR
ncbi:acetyl-coenzyme A synthetase, cytoplasmic [Trichonephila clavipes]|nr:acetyl-coenzyme A synthetase, cytoplasmic [Trichonephila clavipes]